jgi:hypothetical protein
MEARDIGNRSGIFVRWWVEENLRLALCILIEMPSRHPARS